MKLNGYILLVMLFAGCGEGVVTMEPMRSHCPQSPSFVVGGMEVCYQDGMEIDPEMVEFAINSTEKAFNKMFWDSKIDLKALMKKADIFTFYTPYDDPDIVGFRGKYKNYPFYRIQMAYGESGDDCLNRYYVLGHELLHFIADNYLHVSGEDNSTHHVDKVFFYWATTPQMPEFAEYYLFQDVTERCKGNG